jgi:hypothetical protein
MEAGRGCHYDRGQVGNAAAGTPAWLNRKSVRILLGGCQSDSDRWQI